MATFRQIPQEGVSSGSPHRKHPTRSIFSNVSLSPKNWHRNINSFSHNNNNRISETNLVADFNKNVQETSKTARISPNTFHKIEKTTLKQSLPKLLCLKKSTSASDENTFETLDVNALGADNLSWNEYYNVNGNATKSLDCFRRSNSNSDFDKNENASSSSTKHDECLSNPNKHRKSFHQNVEDALSSLLWQPYEYQNKTTATSITSRLVFQICLFLLFQFRC